MKKRKPQILEPVDGQKAENRTVAIVGRPNVGKSALFNRLVRQRIAIVHEQSGVTRDRLSSEVKTGEERFTLFDTGGIGVFDKAGAGDSIDAGILTQVDAAIEDAGLIIFVVDAISGNVPLDDEVARLLHNCNRPVLLAANKADHEKLDAQSVEFEQFGFPVLSVSALHNRGIEDLLGSICSHLPEEENPTEIDPLRVAVVGRPNAGKSSFINRLIRSERVIVSEIAGTTRDSIEVPFTVGSGPAARHYLLIDTAGLRKWGKIKDAVEKYSALRSEKSIERADVCVLVMDATEGPKNRDKKIADLIEKAETGCLVLVNKWDLAEGVTTQREYEKALRRELPFLTYTPIMFASAETGFNIRKIVEAIDEIAGNVSTELSTGLLNRVLHQAFEQTAPPIVKNRRLKMYYATQVGVRPIRIKVFVNSPSLLASAYKKYLLRRMREKFGLEGAPLVLIFNRRRALNDERNRDTLRTLED